ncbi:hypothetical protein HDR61_04235 [bacterium]|nr:hypothetical protein [bacterium]
MKKLLFTSIMAAVMFMPDAFAASSSTPWWKQPTICRISTTNCYASMGAGFDAGMWDAGANCRGMKLICPNALTTGEDEPVPKGKNEISKKTGISDDFDLTVLADGCFGARKTSAGGTKASLNGKYVNVWCRGILDNPSEIVATGEITSGAEPTCRELADNGYVAVVAGKCYGKYYNPRDYYIECAAAQTPNRLIVLNGADYEATTPAGTPTDMSAADEQFKAMYTTSQAQYKKYFAQ